MFVVIPFMFAFLLSALRMQVDSANAALRQVRHLQTCPPPLN
jgi:hypothetical protein